jgi:hypothetical protein
LEVVATSRIKDIRHDDQLSRALKEAVISRAFNHKVVLAFEEGLGRYQNQAPLSKVRNALELLKENPAYSRILKNLTVIVKPAGAMEDALREALDDPGSSVFVFASARAEIKERLKALDGRARSVYIEEERFEQDAYYPLLQVVVLAMRHYLDRPIAGSEAVKALDLSGGVLMLEDMNIESLRTEGAALVIRLLPRARKLETGELIKSYARIMPFLKSA